MLGPGSNVTFYFADQIKVSRPDSTTRLALEELLVTTGEVIVGRRDASGFEIAMDIVSDYNELAGALGEIPWNAEVFWGVWPARDNDGLAALTIDLVDEDGVLRQHPH